MLYLILIILLVIGTLGAATYGGVLLLQSTQNMSDTQTNSRRLEMVAWNLRNSGGVYSSVHANYFGRLEAGTYGTYAVPDPSLFSSPYTQNGINFHYCPVGPASYPYHGTLYTVATPGSGNNYIAEYLYLGTAGFNQKFVGNLRNAANTGDVTVLDSDAPYGTLQIVTMASAGSLAPPQCNALVTTNGTTTVPGGSVVAVTTRQVLNNHIHSASDIMNLYAAASISGDGTGRDALNAMTLTEAMNTWRAIQPRVLIVNLAGGTYSADNATFAAGNLMLGNPLDMKLVLRGAGSGSTAINVTGTSVNLPVDFQMEALTFGSGATSLIAEKGGNLILDGAILNLAQLTLKSGNLKTVGAASTIATTTPTDIYPTSTLSLASALTYSSTASPALHLYGGEIRGSGALSVTAPPAGTGIMITGGLVSTNGNIDIYAASAVLARGILVAPAGQMSVNQSVSVHNTPTVAAIDNAGLTTVASGAALLTPDGAAVGVRLISGGEFSNSGTIGSSVPAARPVIGVQDMGGTKIGGGNTTYPGAVYAAAAGHCWNFEDADSTSHSNVRPNLFSRSHEGPGENSSSADTNQPGLDFLQIDNRSYWTCTGPVAALNPTLVTASEYLDPNGDVAITWDSLGNPAAHNAIVAKGVRQPATPSSNVISAAVSNGNTLSDLFDMSTLSVGTAASVIKVWVWNQGGGGGGSGGTTSLSVRLKTGGVYSANIVLASSTLSSPGGFTPIATGWHSATFTGIWNQTQLDGMQIELNATGPANGNYNYFIPALYAEVTHD